MNGTDGDGRTRFPDLSGQDLDVFVRYSTNVDSNVGQPERLVVGKLAGTVSGDVHIARTNIHMNIANENNANSTATDGEKRIGS